MILGLFSMTVRRVKSLIAWVLAILVVILLASGAWWLTTVV